MKRRRQQPEPEPIVVGQQRQADLEERNVEVARIVLLCQTAAYRCKETGVWEITYAEWKALLDYRHTPEWRFWQSYNDGVNWHWSDELLQRARVVGPSFPPPSGPPAPPGCRCTKDTP